MATEITVAAAYIPNFASAIKGYSPAAGDVVELLWQLDADGLDDDGIPRMRGTGPTVSAVIYGWDAVDGRFETAGGAAMPAFVPTPTIYDGPYVLYIPSFQIDPTSDWLRPKPGRYNVSFRTPDGAVKRWSDWQDIVVPVAPNPIRLVDISLYSKGGVGGWGFTETYSKEEIDAKITLALSSSVANPMTAVGDLIYGGTIVSGFATPARLPIGAAGTFAKSVGGLPTWAVLASLDITTALGYTPENAALKNAASGYAGLSAGSKIAASQIQEVIGLADLVDGAPGAVPTNGHFLKGDGALWSNAALASGDVTTALGYTPENAALKNAASGYAGLSAGSKIASSQMSEVIGLADLVDGAPGAVPTNGHFLKGNGTLWSNAALASGDVTTALGYTPENAALKNAASGYAGLTAGSKVNASQITEVIGLADLADVVAAGPSVGQFVSWNGVSSYVLTGGFPNSVTPTNMIGNALHQSVSGANLTDLTYSLTSYATDPRDFWYWAMFIPGPGKIAHGTHGEYNDVFDGGANFHFMTYTQNNNSRNTVALGSLGIQRAAGTSWGANLIGYTDVGGAIAAAAIGIELNFGCLGTSAAQVATGLYVAAVGNASTPAGTLGNYIQCAVSTEAHPNSRPVHGLVFVKNTLSPISATGALIFAGDIDAGYVIDATLGSYIYGIDFGSSTFSAAGIRFPGRQVAAGAGTIVGPAIQNAENSGVLAVFSHSYTGVGANSDGNQLFIGDFASPAAGAGIDQMRFHVERNAAGAAGSGANRALVSRYGIGGIHLLGWNGSATAPTLVTGAFTGGGTENPSINATSMVGRDPGHVISFSTRTAPAANAKVFAVTFAEAYPNAPVVVLTPETGGVAESGLHVRNRATTGYEVWSGATALTAATAYVLNAAVIGFE